MRLAFRLLVASCFFVVLLFSCKGKNEIIPAYIQIDSVSISATGLQGNNIHEINAVQLYVDGESLGVFELPAKVPALFSGKHQIALIAMTFINASKSQRAVYKPFLIADTTATLVAGKVTTFNNAVFKFRPSTAFLWTEDFEDGNSSLVSAHAEPLDSQIIRTVPYSLNGRFEGNTKALEITLKGADSVKYMDAISFNAFSGLSVNSTDFNLEFDIKSPVAIQIAIDRIDGPAHTYVPFLLIYPTANEWKRYYLNLVPEIYGQPASNSYKIYFTVLKPASYKNDVKVYLDNIRFCYLP